VLVAVATSQSLAQLSPDEHALLAALGDLGILATAGIWSSGDTDWSKFGAVVVRSCWDYHLRVDEFLRWIGHLQERNIRVLNPPDLIRWNLDKRYLQELSQRGLAIPDTVWLAPAEQVNLADACRAHGWQSAVVKPLISASAYRTERKREGFVRGPWMIQEYLSAIESEGEWSRMYFSGAFNHAVKKRATAGDFRVQSDFGGTVEFVTPPRGVQRAANAAMAALPGSPVFARVDMLELGASVLLMQLELIEPELFITLAPNASRRLALAVQSAIENTGN
jgi:glutathione synthase/RimK-type ligase-like ATP-grasp enzyme